MSFSSTGSLFDLFELWLITDLECERKAAVLQAPHTDRGIPTIPHADCDTTANCLFFLLGFI